MFETVNHVELSQEIHNAVQAIIALQGVLLFLTGIIAWFIKRELNNTSARFDKIEDSLFELAGKVQNIIGQITVWNGHERRLK